MGGVGRGGSSRGYNVEGGSLARNSFPTRSCQKETADLEGGGVAKGAKNLHSENYFYNKHPR